VRTNKMNLTGDNRGNGERNLCSLCYLLSNSGRGDEADFTFLARDTASPYIDNRLPALQSLDGGGREYKCFYVLNDEEIGLLSIIETKKDPQLSDDDRMFGQLARHLQHQLRVVAVIFDAPGEDNFSNFSLLVDSYLNKEKKRVEIIKK